MIRVLHFADVINRHDFISSVMVHVNPNALTMLATTLTGQGTFDQRSSTLRVVNLDTRGRWDYPRAVWQLRSLVSATQTDIVHAHHYEPVALAVLALVASKKRLVIGRHYSDSIHRQSHGARRRLYLAVEGLCNRRAARIVVPSRLVQQVLVRQGVPVEKIVRIPYGFDFSRFEPASNAAVSVASGLWRPGPGVRLATFARCHREKGHRTLLKAVRELHADGFPLRWLIVGDGPDRPALSREVVAAGLGDIVSFAGWRTDTVDIMAATDVVVQPTLGEAFSQVMVEAMAMRRALVISDVGGVRDVVEDGVSGIVVPPGEPGPLAAALTQLASPDRRFELGRRAGARVRSELDIRVVVRQFERMYESVTRDPI